MSRSYRRRKNRNPVRTEESTATKTTLNAYAVRFPDGFGIPVNTYVVQPTDGVDSAHDDRGTMVSAVWDWWRENRQFCSGDDYFVIDIDEERVAVPTGWSLPDSEDFGGYRIVNEGPLVARPTDAEHHGLLCKLIKDSIKKRLKESNSAVLGPLWRCFGDYSQMPSFGSASDFSFCRRFAVQPVVLDGNQFVIRIAVFTVCLDARKLDYYFREAKVAELVEMIETKRSGRFDRKGRPIAIQVWCDCPASVGTGVFLRGR